MSAPPGTLGWAWPVAACWCETANRSDCRNTSGSQYVGRVKIVGLWQR
jgi:hypothetical protein